MEEPQHNRTHYKHISTANSTKAIVARAIVHKKKELASHIFIPMGFSVTNTPL